ncbi:MAG TPA: hypothetical protein VFL92_04040 [Sphingomonas sp.]|nr:hypothetical protein [Sphingomonas sp.]
MMQPLSDTFDIAKSCELTRRSLLSGATAAAAGMLIFPSCAMARDTITLRDLILQPVLRRFYSLPPQGRYAPSGLAGYNIDHFRLVELQGMGERWIRHWVVTGREEWRAFGWKMLDIGLSYQRRDGGFDHGYFHSNSILLEAVALSCLLDPAGATSTRLDALKRGCDWMLAPVNLEKGKSQNAPYTHRRYLLAQMFAEASAAIGDGRYDGVAADFASDGMSLQQSDGCNPEMGGGDVSYQMAGVFCAIHYYCVGASDTMQKRLRQMMTRAIAWELQHISPKGVVSMAGSTRVGKEHVFGQLKLADLPTIFQTLAFANAIMPNPTWLQAAKAVATNDRLPI